jgi:hypothetical protein
MFVENVGIEAAFDRTGLQVEKPARFVVEQHQGRRHGRWRARQLRMFPTMWRKNTSRFPAIVRLSSSLALVPSWVEQSPCPFGCNDLTL